MDLKESAEENKETSTCTEGIPPSALCMVCFRPMCDTRCKGSCMRVFHSTCIKEKGKKSKWWKCPLCSKKEIEKYYKILKFVREECAERHEFPGSAFNQLILIDTVVPHKKREVLTPKTVKCSECDKKCRSQLVRCIHCGALYHRGCLPINSITISNRFVICPSHYQSPVVVVLLSLDSSSDYMHKALQDQFDKLKGITVSSGRSSHFFRGRGRGRRGASVNRGGRGGKRLSHCCGELMLRQHIIASDPTLASTKGELIQCQRCGRMRQYPAYIDRSQLPEEWFCEYNVWDKRQCACDENGVGNMKEHQPKEHKSDEEKEGLLKVKLATPAIWGGESMKTNNKFIPSTLNSVALINYIYFSKIAQRAVHRINYLGTVSASYAFNHNLDIPDPFHQSLSENTPLNKMALSLFTYYQGAPHMSIRIIMNNEVLYKSTFDSQKSLLVQCVRYMMEKNLIVLIGEGPLNDDSEWLFNDRPDEKHVSIKELRLRRMFETK